MTQRRNDGGIDRRRLIGMGAAGLGAIGATSLIGSQAAAADDLDATGMPPTGDGETAGSDATEAIPAATTGLRYLNLGIFEFDANNGIVNRNASLGVMTLTSGGFLVASVNPPPGAVIKEVTVWARNTGGAPFSVLLRRSKLDSTGTETLAAVEVPPGTANTVPLSPASAVDHAVSVEDFYYIEAGVAADVNGIRAVRIGYTPAPVFVPIDPARVYDSRQPGYAVNGVLAPNTDRVLSVADGRDGAGAVTTPDVVPAGATAVAYNLTVAGSTGPNFLSIAAGDAATYTASAINFPGGDDRANGGIVKLDASRQVKVFCGDQTGSTHVILDITGYYL